MIRFKRKKVVIVLLLTLFGSIYKMILQRGAAVQQPQDPTKNSFGTDFNKCLFKFWTTFCGPNRKSVLHMPVKCQGGSSKQLCYGANPNQAQFAVCYSTQTKIPLFTGHVLDPNIPEGRGRDAEWRSDPTVGKYFSIIYKGRCYGKRRYLG